MRYWVWGLVKVLKLKLSWDFEAEVWSRFWNWHWSRYWGWNLVTILWLKIGHHFEPEDWRFWSWSLESYCSSQPHSFKWLKALSFLAHCLFTLKLFPLYHIFNLTIHKFSKRHYTCSFSSPLWPHHMIIIISWFDHYHIMISSHFHNIHLLTISTTPTKYFKDIMLFLHYSIIDERSFTLVFFHKILCTPP